MFSDGVLGFVFGFVGFMILAWLLAKYLPRLEYLSGLILAPAAAKKGDEFEVCMTQPAEAEKLSVGVGDSGEVVSTLRPAGKVKFGDCIVDCVAEGDFLAEGTKVTIMEIHGNRVVVKGVTNHY
jgi:membrane-bound serine protease (ClpP class)